MPHFYALELGEMVFFKWVGVNICSLDEAKGRKQKPEGKRVLAPFIFIHIVTFICAFLVISAVF